MTLVCVVSRSLFPLDGPKGMLPVVVGADGNCLFRAASFLKYGHEKNHLELRKLTSAELQKNALCYAQHCVDAAREVTKVDGQEHVDFQVMSLLSLILDRDADRVFEENACQRSSLVEAFSLAVEQVAVSTTQPGTYASLPQLCAFASAVNSRIRSIYSDVQSCRSYRPLLF